MLKFGQKKRKGQEASSSWQDDGKLFEGPGTRAPDHQENRTAFERSEQASQKFSIPKSLETISKR